jgi:hypothetical protein
MGPHKSIRPRRIFVEWCNLERQEEFRESISILLGLAALRHAKLQFSERDRGYAEVARVATYDTA